MTMQRFLILAFLLTLAAPSWAEGEGKHDDPGAIEPNAGAWRTWVIPSGAAYRVPPPPGRSQTRAELRDLRELVVSNDDLARERIAFWDAGSPAYRWIDLINARILAGTATTPYSHRVYTYVAQAMYDATIAAWESKYYYGRRRPSSLDRRL